MANLSTAAFLSKWLTKFASTGTGTITGAFMREFREDIADSFLNWTDDVLDEDNMASNSDGHVSTQQSIKAYIDNQVFGSGVIDQSSRIFEDFYALPQYFNLTAFNNGGGLGGSPASSIAFGLDATEKAIGVFLLNTASSTAGGCSLANTTYILTFGFGYTINQTWRAALRDLSDGTDTFTVELGFVNGTTAAPTQGAFFRYTHSVNGGRWQAVTAVGGVETAEDTGIAGAVDGFHKFRISINDDASQVDFYIDDVKTNDITTNIPNDAAETTGYAATIRKTAGSTSKGFYVDYFDLTATRTTPR